MEGASGERCAAWGGNQLMEMVEKLSMGEECGEVRETEGVAYDTYIGERYDDGLGNCAICLDSTQLAETAVLKGCEHQYCINCILQWATYQSDAPRCPQCKSHFHYIFTYKNLDGTMNDYLQEESVTLLMRARWFNGKAPAKDEDEPLDFYEDDDLEEEDYYFRTHRVVLGNRRFGAGGFVGNGRQQARAVVPKISVRHGGGGGSSSSNSASASSSTSKERTTLPPPQSKKAAERAAKAEAKASKEKARKDAAMSSKKSAAAGGKARAQAPVSSAQAPVSSAHRHTNTTTPDAM